MMTNHPRATESRTAFLDLDGDSEVGEVSTESRSVGFYVLTRLGLRVERTNTVRFANTIDPDGESFHRRLTYSVMSHRRADGTCDPGEPLRSMQFRSGLPG
jgi:hypothetical protein